MEAELAKYGAVGIALTVIGILFWIIKWTFNTGTKIVQDLSASIQANTKVTNENLEYLKKRNGSLEANNNLVCNTLDKITRKLEKIDTEVKDHNQKK